MTAAELVAALDAADAATLRAALAALDADATLLATLTAAEVLTDDR